MNIMKNYFSFKNILSCSVEQVLEIIVKPGVLFILKFLLFTLLIFNFEHSAYSEDFQSIPYKIVVYGEYPVVKDSPEAFSGDEAGTMVGSDKKNADLKGKSVNSDKGEVRGKVKAQKLIDYSKGKDYRQKAMIDALHILSANIYGYTFLYKPGSLLMKTEETFDISLKGHLPASAVKILAGGVYNKIYRVKIEFDLTPSVRKWLSAFHTHTLRLAEAEGTSDFFQGWNGRAVAYKNALRNLVLVEAKRQLSSKPLKISGDILLKGNPVFNVGAGRYYCKIKGWVNIVDVVTYD